MDLSSDCAVCVPYPYRSQFKKHIFLDKKNHGSYRSAFKTVPPSPPCSVKINFEYQLISYHITIMLWDMFEWFHLKNPLTVGNCCKLYLLKNAWRSTGWGKAADWSCCLECNSIIHHWVMCYWCFCPAVSQIQETDSTCSSESLRHRAATCCCVLRKQGFPHFRYLIIYCVMAVNILV